MACAAAAAYHCAAETAGAAWLRPSVPPGKMLATGMLMAPTAAGAAPTLDQGSAWLLAAAAVLAWRSAALAVFAASRAAAVSAAAASNAAFLAAAACARFVVARGAGDTTRPPRSTLSGGGREPGVSAAATRRAARSGVAGTTPEVSASTPADTGTAVDMVGAAAPALLCICATACMYASWGDMPTGHCCAAAVVAGQDTAAAEVTGALLVDGAVAAITGMPPHMARGCPPPRAASCMASQDCPPPAAACAWACACANCCRACSCMSCCNWCCCRAAA